MIKWMLPVVLMGLLGGCAKSNEVKTNSEFDSKATSISKKDDNSYALSWNKNKQTKLADYMGTFGDVMGQEYSRIYSNDEPIKDKSVEVDGTPTKVNWVRDDIKGNTKKLNVVAAYYDKEDNYLYVFSENKNGGKVLIAQPDGSKTLNLKETQNQDLKDAFTAIIDNKTPKNPSSGKTTAATSKSEDNSSADNDKIDGVSIPPVNLPSVLQGTWYSQPDIDTHETHILEISGNKLYEDGQIMWTMRDPSNLTSSQLKQIQNDVLQTDSQKYQGLAMFQFNNNVLGVNNWPFGKGDDTHWTYNPAQMFDGGEVTETLSQETGAMGGMLFFRTQAEANAGSPSELKAALTSEGK